MKSKSTSCQESHPGRDAVLRELIPARQPGDRRDPGTSSWGHTLMETPCALMGNKGGLNCRAAVHLHQTEWTDPSLKPLNILTDFGRFFCLALTLWGNSGPAEDGWREVLQHTRWKAAWWKPVFSMSQTELKGQGRTIPFTFQVWGIPYSCPPMHSSTVVFPIAHSPNGSLIWHQAAPQGDQDLVVSYLTGSRPWALQRTWLSHRCQTISSAATCPSLSHLSLPKSSQNPLFLGLYNEGQGESFSVMLGKGQQTCLCPFLSAGEGDGCYTSIISPCISLPDQLQPGGWRMIYSVAERPCASTGRSHRGQEL